MTSLMNKNESRLPLAAINLFLADFFLTQFSL